jgi:hypothetical protein
MKNTHNSTLPSLRSECLSQEAFAGTTGRLYRFCWAKVKRNKSFKYFYGRRSKETAVLRMRGFYGWTSKNLTRMVT